MTTHEAEHETGELFSRSYLDRGKPLRDSDRLRRRLLAYFQNMLEEHWADLSLALEVNSGADMNDFSNAPRFFLRAEIRDILDAITYVYRIACGTFEAEDGARWLTFVRGAFAVENVGYRVDDHGGVHLLVDGEFERSRVATITALGRPRYRAVLKEFEEAHRALDRDPADGKASIRLSFEAVEILFKLLCGAAKPARLGKSESRDHLVPIVRRLYPGDQTAQRAAIKLCGGFGEWIEAAHFYRHGQGIEEPMPPPLDLAIALVSSGADWLRWLADIDRQANGSSMPEGAVLDDRS